MLVFVHTCRPRLANTSLVYLYVCKIILNKRDYTQKNMYRFLCLSEVVSIVYKQCAHAYNILAVWFLYYLQIDLRKIHDLQKVIS